MSSQQSNQASNSTTTAAEEISRFAHYVEFKTRDLRSTVATYLGTSSGSHTAERRNQDDDDDLFADAGTSDEDWVTVTDDAIEVPEDPSQQKYQPAPPPPPGPIQQTTVATQRAALQALGLTGNYLELGLRLVAEDVGWLTHTATFEDAMQKLTRRFPTLKRLGESYGKGAKKERERRKSNSSSAAGSGLLEHSQENAGTSSRRLTREEASRFGEMQEVPLKDDDDEWDSLYGDT